MNHVVALSGGKDSTALALRLRELNPDTPYQYICTPTGDEFPEMLNHWAKLETFLGPITYLHARRPEDGDRETLQSLIRAQRMLPNHRARWCTRILKIEPCIEYLATLDDPVLYVGLRADEPSDLRAGGVYGDVRQEFPMRDWGWTIQDVWRFLKDRDISIPRRTDCQRCYHQRIGEWYTLWSDHNGVYRDAVEDEVFVSEERGKEHTFRSPQRDSWPASLAELANEFDRGKVPATLARSLYDSAQGNLFDEGPERCRVCSI